jgi:hypothetical protein
MAVETLLATSRLNPSPVTLSQMSILARAVFVFLAVVLLVCALQAQTPKSGSTRQPAPPAPDPGAITNSVYRNTAFGFTYKLPFGWVDRTKEMSEDSSDPKKSSLLLAVFERPPEAAGDTVNSAVVVAAEAASTYPGLRTAEQYFDPLTELTKSKGLKAVNEPYDYPVGARQLVRGDFSKPLGNLTMHQSTLVMMEKGYVVSFTFIGGSEDEVDELLEDLSFGGKATPVPHK